MPFFIGGHPGFNCPLLDGETYEDYYLEFEKEDCALFPVLSRNWYVRLSRQKSMVGLAKEKWILVTICLVDAVTLDELQSRTIVLRSRKHEKD